MSSALETRIQQDVTQAMKARDELTLATLRLVLASLKNDQIAKKRPLTDDDVLQVLQREVKRRREAVALYTQGGKTDQATAEEQEIVVLQRYLPEQMSEAGIETIVRSVIKASGATGPSDFGKVMGAAMRELKGKADGTLVQTILKRELQNMAG